MTRKEKEEKEEKQAKAWKYLQEYRGSPIYAIVNSVSRSGMSRRIEFYVPTKWERDGKERLGIYRIGFSMAEAMGWPYDVDKGGIRVDGCGMDMVYHLLSNFNYRAALVDNPGKSLSELIMEHGRIYDTWFFDANSYGRL